MTFPINAVTRPDALRDQSNGKLDETILVDVGPAGRLEQTAARAWKALAAAAKVAGWNLTWTYGGCYRPYADQVALFKRRYLPEYTAGVTTTSHSRTWNGKRYYKRIGVAAAASPGRSNHGWGLAIDTALDFDESDGIGPNDARSITPAIPWMLKNVERYGFSWELQSEPWHIRYVSGDVIPQAVLDYEANLCYIEPTPYDPENHQFADWPTRSKPNLRLGDEGVAVRYVQDVVKHEAGQAQVGKTDGKFGPKTESGVINVQRWFGLEVDGIVGPQTWDTIDGLAAN